MQQSFVLNAVGSRFFFPFVFYPVLICEDGWTLLMGCWFRFMSKVLKMENIRMKKNLFPVSFRVNPATSKQSMTDWPKLAGHWRRSVSYQWCTKIQRTGQAVLILLASWCSALIAQLKHSCTETKRLAVSPIAVAVKQKWSLWSKICALL